MNRKSTLLTILMLVALLAVPSAAGAQYAANQPWTSTIYYYNPTDDPGSLTVAYYDPLDGSSPTPPTIPVGAHQAGEVYIGDMGVTEGFKGSAVLSADVPVLAVYEQAASGNDPNYGRLLYTAFDYEQRSSKIFIPSFIRDPKTYKSQVGVQVVDGPADVTIKLYNAAGDFVNAMTQPGVPANETVIFDETSLAGILPANAFNGSAVVEMTPGTTAVAAAEEMQTNGRRAYAFEGVSQTAKSVYVPAGFCRYSPGAQTTFLSIQNAGDANTKVRITAYAENTTVQKPYTSRIYTTADIKPGGKVTVSACAALPTTGAYSSSMLVESLSDQLLAVVGKVTASTGLSTAFVGQPAPTTAGTSARVVLPYVNWAANQYKGYRATITVMNASGKDLLAGDVKVTFYDRVAGKKEKYLGAIPANSKRTFTPSSAKALKPDLSFKGAVEVEGPVGSNLIVLVRLEKRITGVTGYTVLGEDYLGVPYPDLP